MQRGVVPGIVDLGIDPNYDEFGGHIVRIWDQILPGSGEDEITGDLDGFSGTPMESKEIYCKNTTLNGDYGIAH